MRNQMTATQAYTGEPHESLGSLVKQVDKGTLQQCIDRLDIQVSGLEKVQNAMIDKLSPILPSHNRDDEEKSPQPIHPPNPIPLAESLDVLERRLDRIVGLFGRIVEDVGL